MTSQSGRDGWSCSRGAGTGLGGAVWIWTPFPPAVLSLRHRPSQQCLWTGHQRSAPDFRRWLNGEVQEKKNKNFGQCISSKDGQCPLCQCGAPAADAGHQDCGSVRHPCLWHRASRRTGPPGLSPAGRALQSLGRTGCGCLVGSGTGVGYKPPSLCPEPQGPASIGAQAGCTGRAATLQELLQGLDNCPQGMGSL